MRMKSKRLITELNEKSSLTEAYCTLRTNLKFYQPDHSIELMNVTSPGIEDGKSKTCANLALTYAKMGEKVLLIDADLRHPTQHRLFQLSNNRGLTNVVAFKEPLVEIAHTVNYHLDVLTSGPLPPNPVEFMSSKAFQTFLESLKGCYDLVIIDTPPVGILTDAALVSTHCDGTLFVVATRKTSISLTKQAKEALMNVNANIIGTVMTMMPTNTKEYPCYVQAYQEEVISRKRKWWQRRKRGVQV